MGLGTKLGVLFFVIHLFLGCCSSAESRRKVERMLNHLKKPAVKIIRSEDGDIIDCVDINQQPALDHPMLRNHIIQMKPNRNSFHVEEGNDSLDAAKPVLLSAQMWLKSGNCPKGTVPIRRVRRHHLLNAPSIENYGKKNTHDIEKYEIKVSDSIIDLGVDPLHAMSVLVAAGYSYFGAKAQINVWNPYIEANDEYSSGQISLRNGNYNNSAIIDVGWIVNPAIYGDNRTRLFIYWTDDSGRSTGCFDHLCPGFVQISHSVCLGAVLYPMSQDHGMQYYLDLYVFKDTGYDGNWWLVYQNTTVIGYWPSDLFTRMYVSDLVLFGGEVYSPRMIEKSSTSTGMGSGQFSHFGWSIAAYIANPRIIDYTHFLKYPDPEQVTSSLPNCYTAENFAEQPSTATIFYYGGPGRSADC